jgi:hypothetical protein
MPPITNKRFGLLLLLFCILLGSLQAHNYLPAPAAPGAPTVIPDIGISRAAYRELTSYGSDWYVFDAEAGEEIFIQMTVPSSIDASFRPSFALVIEHMGRRTVIQDNRLEDGRVRRGEATYPDKLPGYLSGPAGEENLIHLFRLDWSGDQLFFEEHVTGTEYWIRQEIIIPAPVEGRYRVVVFEENGMAGKYVLATGRQERFTLPDILKLPATRIKVRKFMDKPVLIDYVILSILAGVLTWGVANAIINRMLR